MFLISGLVDIAARVCGPRVEFQIHLWRTERYRNFDEQEYFILETLVDSSRASVDVGANMGMYAGKLAKLTKRVYVFEPIPWLASKLRKKLPARAQVYQAAVSNSAGRGVLRVPYNNGFEMHGTSTLEPTNPLPGSTHTRDIECILVRLDDTIQEPVGFIKVDVEGHELSVVEGAAEILKKYRPVLLIESEHRHNQDMPSALFRFLERYGYAGYFLQEGKLRPVSEFDGATDQNVANLYTSKYINNFVFRWDKSESTMSEGGVVER